MKHIFCVFFCALVIFHSVQAQWSNGQTASGVVGQNSYTSGSQNSTDTSGLYHPFSVAIDAVSGAVYAVDYSNNRILRFSSYGSLTNGSSPVAVLGQQDLLSSGRGTSRNGVSSPRGITVDNNSNLYVADYGNNRVLIFLNASSKSNGSNADVVLGQPDFTSHGNATTQNGMDGPYGVAVDNSGNLFVADYNNGRVLMFANAASKSNGANADLVLGQPDFVSVDNSQTTQNMMSYTCGVAIDASGNLFVADDGNFRVLMYANAAGKSNGANADLVLGQTDYGSWNSGCTQSALGGDIYNLAVDSHGNLFVPDVNNNRVLMFASAADKSIGANADLVLGQSNFVSNVSATAQNGMNSPNGLGVDASGNLYVADYENNRIVIFANAPAKAIGANADKVLGQTLFTQNLPNRPEEGFNSPQAIAVEPNSGSLWVVDGANNRVLRYTNAAGYLAHEKPLAVLGQPDFQSVSSGTTASSMNTPSGVACDNSENLYVSDNQNNRILVFQTARWKTNGSAADVVLGQSDFTSSAQHLTQNGLYQPQGLTVDAAGNLFVADRVHSRVLIFKNAASKTNGANADNVLGQSGFTSGTFSVGANLMNFPSGVAVDASENLFVTDCNNSRVLIFKNVLAKTNGSAADIVLGQADFTHGDDANGQNGMRYPSSVAVDGGGSLYVADGLNQRVLIFKNAASLSNGANADYVLGQPNFTSTNSATSQSGTSSINGVALDDAHGYLYVSDGNNNRVLLFHAASALPVELSSFNATVASNSAALHWSTATEVNNYGFEIERRASQNTGWTEVGFVHGNGTSNSPHEYSYTDAGISSGTYAYRLKQIDNSGVFKYSASTEVTIAAPKAFALNQNYPNPFNPTTVISYQLPIMGNVSLRIYDMLGREVETLVNETQEAGSYEVVFNASNIASGVYFYRLQAGDYTAMKRILLVK